MYMTTHFHGTETSIEIDELNLFYLSCLEPLVFLLLSSFKLFGFPNYQLWAYLMKVIPQTPDA